MKASFWGISAHRKFETLHEKRKLGLTNFCVTKLLKPMVAWSLWPALPPRTEIVFVRPSAVSSWRVHRHQCTPSRSLTASVFAKWSAACVFLQPVFTASFLGGSVSASLFAHQEKKLSWSVCVCVIDLPLTACRHNRHDYRATVGMTGITGLQPILQHTGSLSYPITKNV